MGFVSGGVPDGRTVIGVADAMAKQRDKEAAERLGSTETRKPPESEQTGQPIDWDKLRPVTYGVPPN